MIVNIELTESDLKRLILSELQEKLGEVPLTLNDITIEVKSKQNWKSEWETAAFRAVVKRND